MARGQKSKPGLELSPLENEAPWFHSRHVRCHALDENQARSTEGHETGHRSVGKGRPGSIITVKRFCNNGVQSLYLFDFSVPSFIK